jgi:hypothetical protein
MAFMFVALVGWVLHVVAGPRRPRAARQLTTAESVA